MKRILIIVCLFFISCSENSGSLIQGDRILLKEELIIGGNTSFENNFFSNLVSYCVLPNGNIYCLDGEERMVKVFNDKGTFSFSFGRKGSGPGEFLYPKEIISGKDKCIYIFDKGSRKISKFSSTGEFIDELKLKNTIMRIESFNNGNIVVELAEINFKNISESITKLIILDQNLEEIKGSFYQVAGTNLTWVESNPNGQMFAIPIPFSTKLQWQIIGDKLYMGDNSEYDIKIFSAEGDSLGNITGKFDREIVSSDEKERWIEDVLSEYGIKPNAHPELIKKSLNKIDLPKYKPSFSKLSQISENLLVFLNPKDNGTPGILYKNNLKENQNVVLEHNDFKYFHGKFYRITSDEENPFTLTRYIRVN